MRVHSPRVTHVEQELLAIVAGLQEGLVVVAADGRITRANPAAASIFGVALGELVGSRIEDTPARVLTADGAALSAEQMPSRRALAGESVNGMRVQFVRRDGSRLWIEINSSPLTEADGSSYGALSTYLDVTDRVERERRIRHEADHDPLTGLANRRTLERTLGAAVARAGAHGHEVAVLLLDLDGFKAINDAYGHATGDVTLREVAARLRRVVRERDLVARAGGDEFVVVLPDLARGDGVAQECAARVDAALAEPLSIGRVHAAVGVACFPDHGADAAALLAHADRAMYAQKAPGLSG
jgi:diguanylate cyclase (GGDEF)-like protein/PAS domain S-box-containing protein